MARPTGITRRVNMLAKQKQLEHFSIHLDRKGF